MIGRQTIGIHIAIAHFPAVPTKQQISSFIKANGAFFQEFQLIDSYIKVLLESRLRVLQHYRGNMPTEPVQPEFDPKISDELLALAREMFHKDVFSICINDVRIEGDGDDRFAYLPRIVNIVCDVIALQVFQINEFSSIFIQKKDVENVFDEIEDLKLAQKSISPEDAAKFDVPPFCMQRANVIVKFTDTPFEPKPRSAFERVW